jgi:hypothetical protein
MTEWVPIVLVVALVGFSILRAVLPRRVTVIRRPDGGFEFQRPLGRRLLDIGRLGFWTVLLMIFWVAALLAQFVFGVLVAGVAIVVLVWRAADRIRRSTVVIDRAKDELRDGEEREGRASDVQGVVLNRLRREPLALRIRDEVVGERSLILPVVDAAAAESLGHELADYLRVPLEKKA